MRRRRGTTLTHSLTLTHTLWMGWHGIQGGIQHTDAGTLTQSSIWYSVGLLRPPAPYTKIRPENVRLFGRFFEPFAPLYESLFRGNSHFPVISCHQRPLLIDKWVIAMTVLKQYATSTRNIRRPRWLRTVELRNEKKYNKKKKRRNSSARS